MLNRLCLAFAIGWTRPLLALDGVVSGASHDDTGLLPGTVPLLRKLQLQQRALSHTRQLIHNTSKEESRDEVLWTTAITTTMSAYASVHGQLEQQQDPTTAWKRQRAMDSPTDGMTILDDRYLVDNVRNHHRQLGQSEFDTACADPALTLYHNSKLVDCECNNTDEKNKFITCAVEEPQCIPSRNACFFLGQIWYFIPPNETTSGGSVQHSKDGFRLDSLATCALCAAGNCSNFNDFCVAVDYNNREESVSAGQPEQCAVVLTEVGLTCSNCFICLGDDESGAEPEWGVSFHCPGASTAPACLTDGVAENPFLKRHSDSVSAGAAASSHRAGMLFWTSVVVTITVVAAHMVGW